MGILTDYFIAASDAEAAAFLDTGVYGRGLPDDHVLEAKGIDPYVALGTLETILTGPPATEVEAEKVDVTFSMETGAVVARVPRSLLQALTGTGEQELLDAADAWSRTEELSTDDPSPLAEFLRGLTGLARTASAENGRVYCWASP